MGSAYGAKYAFLTRIILFPYINHMNFEYDPVKSATNKIKHGIDFEEAQTLWKDPYALTAPLGVSDEPRMLVVAMFKEKLWTAVITHRNEAVRIISVRRARKDEVIRYEKSKANAQNNLG